MHIVTTGTMLCLFVFIIFRRFHLGNSSRYDPDPVCSFTCGFEKRHVPESQTLCLATGYEIYTNRHNGHSNVSDLLLFTLDIVLNDFLLFATLRVNIMVSISMIERWASTVKLNQISKL